MSRFTLDQLDHAASFKAPLDRASSIEFLRALDIMMSVGHWSAGDFFDRFAPVGYHSDDATFGSDFEAQCLRTLRNLTRLLASEGASWHDVVRTTCYLRDIDRDYRAFNEVRTLFMTAIGLDPLPASTGIQAGICRPDLLVEIEAIAIVPRE